MNKLEEIAKNGGTIDASTLVESLKELKRESKVQIVDQGKSLRYDISTGIETNQKAQRTDFERLRVDMIEQLHDEQEVTNQKIVA